jgi:hypothetical protein
VHSSAVARRDPRGVAALGGCSSAPSDLCVPGEAVSCTDFGQYPEGATVAALASSPYGSMGWLPAPLGTPNPCSGQGGEYVFVVPPSCAVDLISVGNNGCQIYPETHN